MYVVDVHLGSRRRRPSHRRRPGPPAAGRPSPRSRSAPAPGRRRLRAPATGSPDRPRAATHARPGPGSATVRSSSWSRSVCSRRPAYAVAPSVTTTSSTRPVVNVDGRADAEAVGAVAEDLADDGERPLLDAQRLRAGHEAADQRLPDQRVDQADHHGVAGDHRQQQEQRAVGDAGGQRADGVADGEPIRRRRSGRGRRGATGSAPKTAMTPIATTQLGDDDRVAGSAAWPAGRRSSRRRSRARSTPVPAISPSSGT